MMKEEAARSAVLWIFSDDIRASSMEELLSAPADYSEDKGTTPTGRRYPAAMHAWAVRKNGDDSMEIEAIVTALLDRIRPAKAAIADLAARGCQVRLELVLHASPVDRSTSSFLVSRDTVSDLQQMGASIAVNQYVNPRRFDQWFHGTEPAG